jgi:hypothetical protein
MSLLSSPIPSLLDIMARFLSNFATELTNSSDGGPPINDAVAALNSTSTQVRHLEGGTDDDGVVAALDNLCTTLNSITERVRTLPPRQ